MVMINRLPRLSDRLSMILCNPTPEEKAMVCIGPSLIPSRKWLFLKPFAFFHSGAKMSQTI